MLETVPFGQGWAQGRRGLELRRDRSRSATGYDSVRRFSGEATRRQSLLSLITTPSSTTRALCSYSLTLPVRLLPGYRSRT